MIGAIIGDIVGSIYEFDNIKTKDFPLFSAKSTFTDDTVCTIAVAEAILDGSDVVASLRKWCNKYSQMSYGSSFRRWLGSDKPMPYDSWGNGAAMRVSPAAFLATSLEQAREQAVKVTSVTHNHPEGLKGALATADAIWFFRHGETDPDAVGRHIAATYGYDMGRTVDSIRPTYRFNESCQETVPEAIICALAGRDFEDVIRNAISVGGDSDTVAAIAGAVGDARFSNGIPEAIRNDALRRLPDDLHSVVIRMYPEQLLHT
jgi:ADP-ribosyl-[dinitrogen reductase] hydrolase